MEGEQIRTSKESRNTTSKRSERAAYHRRRPAAGIRPVAKLEILVDLEVGNHLHSMENIFQVHLEGGDASGVKPPGHIADAVATPLQRKHPAAEPTGNIKTLTHPLGDPRHLVVKIDVTFTRFL